MQNFWQFIYKFSQGVLEKCRIECKHEGIIAESTMENKKEEKAKNLELVKLSFSKISWCLVY